MEETTIAKLTSLKSVVSSGEALSEELAKSFFQILPSSQLINFFGSTETTGDVTFIVLRSIEDVVKYSHDSIVSIGVPLENTIIELIDNYGQHVKLGEVGEILVTGSNVCAATICDGNLVLYGENKPIKMGDMAFIEDGNLYYSGRIDWQIKIRGHRINLQQIEELANSHPDVKRSVLFNRSETNTENRLILCYEGQIDERKLESYLADGLPQYSVPNVVARLPKIALQKHTGKIDRKATEAAYIENVKSSLESVNPDNIEKYILTIICTELCLPLERISVQDSFFHLGGTSTSAVITVARLKEVGYSITISQFLNCKLLDDVIQTIVENQNQIQISDINNDKFHTRPLRADDKSEVFRQCALAFLTKTPLDVAAGVTTESFYHLLESGWKYTLDSGVSLVVENNDGKVVGGTMLFDLAAPVEPSFVGPAEMVGNILNELELPVIEEYCKEGRWLDSFAEFTDDSLQGDENAMILYKLGQEKIRVGVEKGFDGIITVDAHPVTLEMDLRLFGYIEIKRVYPKFWVFNGQKPFDGLRDDYAVSFFGFGPSADIEVVLDGHESRKLADIKTDDGKKERCYLYYDGETVSGKVNINMRKAGSKLEHQGIKIEFIGQIELYYDRGNHHEFTSLVKELARPGEITSNSSYDFEFVQVEKPYESYTGANVRLRYFLRVTVVKRITDLVKEVDMIVHTLAQYPEMNNSIKMEVGIEDCLHIEFEYNKSKYHLKDVIVGKIYFLLVRIKIKYMEIQIIKRETTGAGQNSFSENDTIAKYEIMDGAPVRGESIPIRLFLSGYELTPTMKDINKKFSEITIFRKAEKVRKPIQQGHKQKDRQVASFENATENNTQ
ncbi:DgyrCDS2457 [Dimorphilus gyrociliatus]|uniref:DgyrCDS2457 n=1 Tax=Dimorphilus gyrociliatus TaxID=2664684 RepID=A0A7I8VC58_9ANNE|nr:DgyrCDS2457 [Dimorphilus gyrociliatus]